MNNKYLKWIWSNIRFLLKTIVFVSFLSIFTFPASPSVEYGNPISPPGNFCGGLQMQLPEINPSVKDTLYKLKQDSVVLFFKIRDHIINEPIPFSSVVINSGEKLLCGALTDFNGNAKFKVKYSNKPLSIRVTFVGYRPYILKLIPGHCKSIVVDMQASAPVTYMDCIAYIDSLEKTHYFDKSKRIDTTKKISDITIRLYSSEGCLTREPLWVEVFWNRNTKCNVSYLRGKYNIKNLDDPMINELIAELNKEHALDTTILMTTPGCWGSTADPVGSLSIEIIFDDGKRISNNIQFSINSGPFFRRIHQYLVNSSYPTRIASVTATDFDTILARNLMNNNDSRVAKNFLRSHNQQTSH